MPRLHLNIDHVATLRQARRETFPDPIAYALAAERAGAQGITCHLRKDRRHIRDADVVRLRQEIASEDSVLVVGHATFFRHFSGGKRFANCELAAITPQP